MVPRRFLCTPGDALNLAVFRVVVFALLLVALWRTDGVRYAEMPAELRVAPAGYATFFHLIPWNTGFVRLVRAVGMLASCSALIGFASRAAALIACLCALYVLGLPELFGKIDHLHHHLIWFAALLAASPSGDALAFDAVPGEARTAPSVAYGLPLRCAWLLIGVAYFFAGLAKLAAGPEWIFSDNLKNLMHGFWAAKGFVPAIRIDRYPLLCQGAAAATVAFEVGFLPALFFPRLRRLAVMGGVAFHILTFVYLRILFVALLACYAVFVDWEALWRAVRARAWPTNVFIRDEEPSADRRRMPAGVVAPALVGALLLAVNVYCGVRGVETWPFSVFPRFAAIAGPEVTNLEVVVRRSDGSTRPIDAGLRLQALRDLLQANLGERGEHLAALGDYLARHEVHLSPGDTLQIFAVTRSIAPEDRDAEPRERTLLAELHG